MCMAGIGLVGQSTGTLECTEQYQQRRARLCPGPYLERNQGAPRPGHQSESGESEHEQTCQTADQHRVRVGLPAELAKTIDSYYGSFDKRATLMIMAISDPQKIGQVDKAVKEELARLLADGVKQEELDKARQGYLEAQKVGRSSDPALAGLLSNLRYTGRTMAYEAELEMKIQALTPEQVATALRKYIDPRKLIVVGAGDFEAKAGPVTP